MSTLAGTAHVPDQRPISPNDLLAMPDEINFELDDGRLLERIPMGAQAGWVSGEVLAVLWQFNRQRRLGWVFPSEIGYRCFGEHQRVRRPDVSFVRLGRLPGDEVPKGYIDVPPDLAVEVLSPHDIAYEVERKTQQFLEAGVPLIWIVNPDVRTVRVHRADGSVTLLQEDGELDGEDVLPGFRHPVRELFPSQKA